MPLTWVRICPHLCRRFGLQPRQIEIPGQQGLRQPAAITHLLATEADAAQGSIIEGEKARGCDRAHGGLQAGKGGVGRGQRYLLFEDDVQEGGKAGRSAPTAAAAQIAGPLSPGRGRGR